MRDAPAWSLVGQQCPQLQALAMDMACPLCLTALTSLTCNHWLPQDTHSIQCSQLAKLQCSQLVDLHVQMGPIPKLLPSTITSLSLNPVPQRPLFVANLQDQHLRSLVHIRCMSHLMDLSDIQGLVPAIHPVLATSVTPVELTIHPAAFIPPDMDEQPFPHLGAWFPHLQRVQFHLIDRALAEAVLNQRHGSQHTADLL